MASKKYLREFAKRAKSMLPDWMFGAMHLSARGHTGGTAKRKKKNKDMLPSLLDGLDGKSVSKSSPSSSEVHVKVPLGDFEKEILKAVGMYKDEDLDGAYDGPDDSINGSYLDEGDGEPQNLTKELTDMQRIVQGTDWEISAGADGEGAARNMAMDNMADDAEFYGKRLMAAQKLVDAENGVTKDVYENEEASVSDWPVGLDLDLCSGPVREPGYIGFDLYPHDHGTIVHDLTLGIPVDKEVAKNVRLVDGLEHMELADPMVFLKEIQRVLQPGGKFFYQGPDGIYDEQSWAKDLPGLVLTDHEETEPVDKDAKPIVKQTFSRVAYPDPATSDDAQPRLGVEQYSQLPADAFLAMDAMEYSWSDGTSSGRDNRLHGYPSQGALMNRPEENAPNGVGGGMSKAEKEGTTLEQIKALLTEFFLGEDDVQDAEIDKRIAKSFETARKVGISKLQKAKQIVFCVVLSPDELDSQDDWMTAEDIEEAAHYFMSKSRTIGSNHEKPIDAHPVESYIAPQDLTWEEGPYGPQTVKKGAWVLGIKVNDKKEWAKVESGDYQGFSVGGMGTRS